MKYRVKDVKRFWSKVDKHGPDECWEWQAYKFPPGYGGINLSGKMVYVHRFVWIIANGQIPPGMCVCHHCDNPGCCNLAHLFLGTHADNMSDRDAKGRQADKTGEQNPKSKVTVEEVRTIRKRYAAGGITYRELGEEFEVSTSAIAHIVKRYHWAHVS